MEHLKLKLTSEEKKLFEDIYNLKVSQRIRNRIEVLILFDKGLIAKDISKELNLAYQFVIKTHKKWIKNGIPSLFDKYKKNKNYLITDKDLEIYHNNIDRNKTWEEKAKILSEITGKNISSDRLIKRSIHDSMVHRNAITITKTYSYINEDDYDFFNTDLIYSDGIIKPLNKQFIYVEREIKYTILSKKNNLEIPKITYDFSQDFKKIKLTKDEKEKLEKYFGTKRTTPDDVILR